MSHINILHPKTGMWRCWSTVIDDWVSDWMSEADYKENGKTKELYVTIDGEEHHFVFEEG